MMWLSFHLVVFRKHCTTQLQSVVGMKLHHDYDFRSCWFSTCYLFCMVFLLYLLWHFVFMLFSHQSVLFCLGILPGQLLQDISSNCIPTNHRAQRWADFIVLVQGQGHCWPQHHSLVSECDFKNCVKVKYESSWNLHRSLIGINRWTV